MVGVILLPLYQPEFDLFNQSYRHLPVGLLYDLHVMDQSLPWQITIHFERFPENKLMKFPAK